MTPAQTVERIPFGPVTRSIARYLANHFEIWIDTDTLARVAYEDRADGGPDDAPNVLKSNVHLIRRKLAPFGYGVEGSSFCGRRMVRLAADRRETA